MCKAGNILSDLAQGKSVWGYLYSNEAVSYTHLDVYKRQIDMQNVFLFLSVGLVAINLILMEFMQNTIEKEERIKIAVLTERCV